MRRITPLLLVLSLVLLPLSVFAQTQLIPCGGSEQNPCTFKDLAVLAQNVIKFLAFYIATPLATLAIMYAGFKYLTSLDKPGSREEAKKILWNVLIGFFWVLAAWLVIDTLLDVLLKSNPLN
ncbi:MAG TPA: hypothetical protein DCZ84_02225 [Candidatus Vogelbacteria bacterium]|uniref:TrbC/VIRB2 family protein n=1 Tax=Candidatus Vogelbacteria bacterium RIFOXYD1_FULL_51_18 TaxID=1802440 RepID=A0A1G2QHY2_9BACT|nr:MAG: hypothetical protein UY66_C0005G0007 [Parcubacteria group bacterium GW2011_GWC1_51_35]KKW25348.1 MAG: hypothetical protein UY68_C0003G0048 [Parcubacteria group bacterium GW2011_GWF2_52_12]OHA60196.1 MAG: hypothetical protein A2569_01375 [Candidatus Vogelbacteria bacterium RIFOXYD1_FULL_51_18]HBB65428.1 hypothetical protein [Candidatus Vogelbacteria bacterium]HBC43938.1 hypothetical protein [Candidatus Vogelbacteria bacterium]